MLSNYIEQLFKLDNYYDGLIVTDNKGYIEFFMTYRPDISGAKQEDLSGADRGNKYDYAGVA